MLEWVFEGIILALTTVTGHLVLRVVTLGRWKLTDERCDLATLVGCLFWLAIGVGIYFAFFR
jgi:hypothetical protein